MSEKNTDINYLTNCFYSGKYTLILKQLGINQITKEHPYYVQLSELQIGSLVFLGQFIEAQILYESILKTVSNNEFKIKTSFYLVIANVRLSKYKEAKKLFYQICYT